MLQEGAYDGRRVMGVTTLDIVRSCTFLGELNGIDPTRVSVPVIGGHSENTIIPLFSRSSPIPNVCSLADIRALTTRVQQAGVEVNRGHLPILVIITQNLSFA